MSLWKIAWRSLQQRALSSWLTGLSMALGVALVVAVLVIYGVVARSFNEAAQGYHLILGAKGGKLQLVLNTVFHLSTPIENIPWDFYKQFIEYEDEDGNLVSGSLASTVEVAVPLCLGDSYKEFRVVGTTPDLFEKLSYGANSDGTLKHYQFAAGENLHWDDFNAAVIGSVTARKTGLKIGDKFPITHGLAEDENAHVHEEDQFHVVGILEPTGTPNDRAIFVNLEGFLLIAGHSRPVAEGESGDAELRPAANERRGRDGRLPLPEPQREVTAILLLMKTDVYSQFMRSTINDGQVAQAVAPAAEVANLFNGIVGPIQWVLLVLAGLVVVVSGIGVMVSIYNSMSDRSREIAIIRALGAERSTVMLIVLLESILLSLLGGLAGVAIGHAAIAMLDPIIVAVAQTGISIGAFQFQLIEFVLIPALIVLAALVGYLPALAAYRTDVARALKRGTLAADST